MRAGARPASMLSLALESRLIAFHQLLGEERMYGIFRHFGHSRIAASAYDPHTFAETNLLYFSSFDVLCHIFGYLMVTPQPASSC